ncbi:hypothetical protein C8F01DRAFT_986196, partial [Mycena amicta]
AKEKALAGWTDKWKKTHPTGGFASADRIPPSWKPRPHFAETKREVYGRVVQCRTGHAFIGEYYAYLRRGYDVSAGTRFQTREHILRECELYEDHRHILRDHSTQVVVSDILGTMEGI